VGTRLTRVINVQGADHHSTITRVRAGLQAMEMGSRRAIPITCCTNGTVMRGGEEVKISKRAGDYRDHSRAPSTSGRDAVRYFLVSRKG